MSISKKSHASTQPKDKLLPKLTIFFFDKALITALLWLALVVFGALSYTTLLKREGFPSVNIPYAFINGTYFVNDPAKVDSEAAKPIVDLALKRSDISAVQSQSTGTFFSVQIQYKEGTDAKAATDSLQKDLKDSGKLPQSAAVQFAVPYFGATGGDLDQIDEAASFYSADLVTPQELAVKASDAAKWLKDQKIAHVKDVYIKNPFQEVTNPATGQAVTVQRSFDRYGVRKNGQTAFYDSIIIGIAKEKGADVIDLHEKVEAALERLRQDPQFKGFDAEVSASFAPGIEDNIGELQRVLLEGLIAVLVVGSIVIAIRASAITVVAMVTTVLATLGFLYVIGYTLNVITLFGLILGLALIVDDTIIMVEAIDSARARHKDRRQVVKEATRRISRAMVAATTTASLCFAPLLFVGGILGSFIRAIPITLISSLVISLFVSLLFIPFMARFALLGRKQLGKKQAAEHGAAGFEKHLAEFIARPMLWARHSKAKLFTVGITAVIIGTSFLFAGLFIAKDVVFNIFPPTKDTNGLVLNIAYRPSITISDATKISEQIDTIAARVLGDNYVKSSYYGSGSDQTASEQIELISYNDRSVTSRQLADQLQSTFDKELKEATVAVGQLDIGPPTNSFIVELDATNRTAAFAAAKDIAAFMNSSDLERINGSKAKFINVSVTNPAQYVRSGEKQIISVSSGFNADDTSTLITLAQDAVEKEFTPEKLTSYGLERGALTINIGQESENQDSFKTLAIAFPLLLIVIYILLAVEFRSLLQPLLIYMAIPFSIFGVMLGLRLTNNAISFFTMLGFFALVGLSIKNTILLTDYANQARHSGMSAIDAAVAALEERFRPLFATSMTAVVSLIPLAISSPFWQGLAVVLIFGLLSSTFLVVTVFPYYYLGAEYLRLRIRARHFLIWAFGTMVFTVTISKVAGTTWGLATVPLSLLWVIVYAQFNRRTRAHG